MTEQTQVAEVNPFDPESYAHGGGLWDGKTVTITGSVAKTEALAYGDGKPVLDDKGQQSIQTGLVLSGIADGGDDKERKETYSAGDRVVPTPDGTGFVMKDGSPLKFHANANIAKLGSALKASGFDLATLWDAETRRQRFDKLVGARFVMKGEPRLGRDGKPLKDKKGYDKTAFYPAKFLGYAAGAVQGTVAVAHAPGNGAVSSNGGGDALKAKAVGAVLNELAEGPLTRAELVRGLAQRLAGDSDANAIIGLVVRDSFHQGQVWKYDGVTASL